MSYDMPYGVSQLQGYGDLFERPSRVPGPKHSAVSRYIARERRRNAGPYLQNLLQAFPVDEKQLTPLTQMKADTLAACAATKSRNPWRGLTKCIAVKGNLPLPMAAVLAGHAWRQLLPEAIKNNMTVANFLVEVIHRAGELATTQPENWQDLRRRHGGPRLRPHDYLDIANYLRQHEGGV